MKKENWLKTIGMTALFTKDGFLNIYSDIELYKIYQKREDTIVGGIIQKVNRSWVYLFIPSNKIMRVRKKLVKIIKHKDFK